MDSESPDSYDLNFSSRPVRIRMPITMRPVARHHAEGGVPEPAGFSISKCSKSGRV